MNNYAKYTNSILFITLFSTYSISNATEIFAGIKLPGIPTEITDPVKRNPAKNESKRTQITENEVVVSNKNVYKMPTANANNKIIRNLEPKVIIDVKPGINQLIPISVNHLNRIVTPFENPQVKTVSTASTEVVGNVVYVATDSKAPVTMFITDNEDNTAISITLTPKRIPPREVVLQIKRSDTVQIRGSNAKARKWEEASKYVETIKQAFSGMAKGKTPPGYTLRLPDDNDESTLVNCRQPALTTHLGQVLDGSNIFINIYVARNTSNVNIEINETLCYRPGVMAISSWPRTVLAPGESTELFVAHNRKLLEKNRITRPSLITSNN